MCLKLFGTVKKRMGRYAFFNTEFEYKFWFATQDSKDITEFYGDFDKDSYDDQSGQYHISWNASLDKDRIRKRLDRMCEKYSGLPFVQWSKFPNHLDGTYTLRDYVTTHTTEIVDGMVHAKYVLGCLIYHQLMYKEELECDFEG
jgi:hypothetical protein